jgi:GNAT superfamily N-acetyltransferase
MPREPGPTLNLNGYTDLPPGTVAAVVTYLEMKAPPPLSRIICPDGYGLSPVADVHRYRALFRRVGEPWLWFSRAAMQDGALAAILDHPQVEAYALTHRGTDVGLLELDFRPNGECELVYFGLVPDAIGQGIGRYLMNEAISRAFRAPIHRFFVHTCSLDHPAALPFYMRSGFTPYKRAIEVAPDPRLAGRLPREAAPQIPVLPGPTVLRTRRVLARPRRLRRSVV